VNGVASVSLSVPGMSCGHCQAAVIREVSAVPGVERVDVDLESKQVDVIGSDLQRDAIVAAIDEAGYDVA
jgi:copper chaperone CopZ